MKQKEKSYDARAVANRLIGMAWADGRALDMMQVIKLVYLCDAWMLGIYQRPMVKQEIEVWQYGPVVADVFNSLKRYNGFPVHDKIRKPYIWNRSEYTDSFDDEAADIIEQVYEKYGFMTGVQISALTHEKGSPWHQLSELADNGQRNVAIPREIIKAYYTRLMNEAREHGNTRTVAR